MLDSNINQSQSKNVAGGCSMGCASVFVLAGILWPLLYALGGNLDENAMMGFPTIVAMPCFLIGHILALLGVFSKSDDSKMWGKTSLFVMWGSIVAFFLILLVAPKPTEENVAGNYDGSFGGVLENLKLETNGNYIQILVLPSGEKVNNTGTWSLHHRAVTLDNYLVFIDTEHNSPLTPPQQYGFMTYGYSSGLLFRDLGPNSYSLKRY